MCPFQSVIAKAKRAFDVVDRLKKVFLFSKLQFLVNFYFFKDSYRDVHVLHERKYELRSLTNKLDSLLDRPDIDLMNDDFESRQSKWLMDMAVSTVQIKATFFPLDLEIDASNSNHTPSFDDITEFGKWKQNFKVKHI